MQQELAEYFRNPLIEPGLLLAEAPTSYGKTYQAIGNLLLSETGRRTAHPFCRRAFEKNLPVDDLRRAYEQDGRGDAFAKEVLVLRSATDTVLDALKQQRFHRVPDRYLHALENAFQKYKRYRDQPGDAASELAQESLLDSIRTDLEPGLSP